MTVGEFIDQNGLTDTVQQYLDSSGELYGKLDLDVLGFVYDQEADTASTTVTPAAWLQGHEGVVQGGIAATYLDTVSGVHALLHSMPLGKGAFTKTISIEYRAPMLVGKEYRVVSTHKDKAFTCAILDVETVVVQAELIFAFK